MNTDFKGKISEIKQFSRELSLFIGKHSDEIWVPLGNIKLRLLLQNPPT